MNQSIAPTAAQPANRQTRDVHSWLLLGCATLLAALHFVSAFAARAPDSALPMAPFIALVMLLTPALGAWQGRGRSGFWYALLSTLFVAHAFVVAANQATQGFGFALLAASLLLFIEACAYARHRGLAAH